MKFTFGRIFSFQNTSHIFTARDTKSHLVGMRGRAGVTAYNLIMRNIPA